MNRRNSLYNGQFTFSAFSFINADEIRYDAEQFRENKKCATSGEHIFTNSWKIKATVQQMQTFKTESKTAVFSLVR